MFTRAVKTDAKLRLALAGPPGCGKSYTAQLLAHALAEGQGVAVIDTEHGSASKYEQHAGLQCFSTEICA